MLRFTLGWVGDVPWGLGPLRCGWAFFNANSPFFRSLIARLAMDCLQLFGQGFQQGLDLLVHFFPGGHGVGDFRSEQGSVAAAEAVQRRSDGCRLYS